MQVGAVFTFNTINGKVARIAMKAAEDDVNSDPSILGGSRLSILIHDSNFNEFLGIIGGKLFSLLFSRILSCMFFLLTRSLGWIIIFIIHSSS